MMINCQSFGKIEMKFSHVIWISSGVTAVNPVGISLPDIDKGPDGSATVRAGLPLDGACQENAIIRGGVGANRGRMSGCVDNGLDWSVGFVVGTLCVTCRGGTRRLTVYYGKWKKILFNFYCKKIHAFNLISDVFYWRSLFHFHLPAKMKPVKTKMTPCTILAAIFAVSYSTGQKNFSQLWMLGKPTV